MMKRLLVLFFVTCVTMFVSVAGGSPLDEYLMFETFGDDCYADGSPLWEDECYALVWRNGDAATRVDGLFKSDGTVVDASTMKILAVFPAAVQTNYDGNVYSCARRSWSLMNPMDMTMWEKKGGVLSLFVFDTRRWNTSSQAWELAGCDVEARTVSAIRRYGLVTDLEDIQKGMAIGIFEWDTTAHGTSFVTSDELTLFGDTTEQYSGTVNKAVDVSDELVVSFDANGGEPVPATMRTAGAKCGKLPEAVKTGYVFDGWYTAREDGEPVTADTEVTGDVTYYARWTANKYKVCFDGQGGTESMPEQAFVYDVSQALSANAFVRRGYTFAGWATAAGGEVAYADGAVVSNLTAEAGATVTLFAVWTANDNTVTFDANGGTADETSRAVKTDEELGELPAASRTGYAQAGWYTAAVGGEPVTAATVVTAPVTYYAQWTANNYTVDFNERGGTGSMDDQPMTYDQEEALYSNLFTRVGYTFLGWTDDAEELMEVLYCDGVVVSNLTDEANGEYDLYAVWQANDYVVKFHANGGEGEMGDQAFVYDQEQALAENEFLKVGYAVAHWTNAVGEVLGCCAVVSNLTAVADGVVDLFAVWIEGENAVTFDACGGKASESYRLVRTGDKLGALPAVSRAGYTFDGWFTEPSGGEEVTADIDVTEPVKFYAQWTVNRYTVGFDERGGEGAMPDQPMTYDQEEALYGNLFTRVGYTFLGWTDDEAELKEVLYYDGVVVSNLTEEADGEVGLYAVWQANAYTVKFHANGGEGEMADQDFVYDQAQPLRKNDFVNQNDFKGWATEADGVVTYADGEEVKNLTADEDGSIDLYAVWLPSASIDFGIKSSVSTKGVFGTVLKSYSVSGLPKGLTYNAKDGTISGTVTKKTLIKSHKVTFTKKSARYEMLLVVKAPPTVDVELWGDPASDTNGCSVAGAGSCVIGKTVKLSVSLPKASSSQATEFLGWYLRKGGEETPWPKSSTYRKTSVSCKMKSTSLSLVAKVRVEARDSVKVDCAGLRVNDGVLCAGVDGAAKGIPLQVETISGDPKSVTVTGLPTGMTYDKKTNTIQGAPTKAGEKKTVTIKVTTVNGVTQSVKIPVVIAAMEPMSVGTFAGFVVNANGDDVGTFRLTAKGSGSLSAKVVRAAGSCSFSDTAWNSLSDGVYSVTMKAKTGERLSLQVNSRAAWNEDQLTGTFTDAKGASCPVTAQRNALADPWYFAAAGDETSGWTLAYTDKSHADLTVKIGAAGATTVSGTLAGVPVKKKGKLVPVSFKISASGYVNVGLMTNGVLAADFVPIVKVDGKKNALSIRTNLWMDRKNASEFDVRLVGEAKVAK